MPIFSDTPPQDPRGPSFQIVRTPTGKPLTGIVTSENLVGCYTHFWKRRTMPCERDDCEACRHGIPFRWHAYLSAYLSGTLLHCIFECTAQAAERFVEYREAQGTIRGCQFTASRMNYARNARIIITTRPADLTRIQLPKPPNIEKVLAILWNLPIPEVKADRQGDKRGQRTVTHRPRKSRQAAADLPDPAEPLPTRLHNELNHLNPTPPQGDPGPCT